MKIIGKTEDGFILESHQDEVANLIGYYYANTKSRVMELKVGDQIDVHGMFYLLWELSSKKSKILEMKEVLREAADKLDLVEPLIPAVKREIV